MKNKFSRCNKCKKIYIEVDYRNNDGVCEKCKNDYKLLKSE